MRQIVSSASRKDCKQFSKFQFIECPACYGMRQILNGCVEFLHIRFTVSKNILIVLTGTTPMHPFSFARNPQEIFLVGGNGWAERDAERRKRPIELVGWNAETRISPIELVVWNSENRKSPIELVGNDLFFL